ncbi:NAD(P)-dependent alcohol dehydrogenase [Chitinophaga sp. Cy-1792]|uniref:zinc-dependent alcohol dehydrogenase family protein n=1 Tax=Chitinophaga sp. Cy-1792 TaxID=2608339 RepID=UPI001420DDEE|nr:NAD(P)-dependent alcohol dehydrogenase [Chitinophaga sp. Cy-1792]
MKTIQINQSGIDQLTLNEVPAPVPGDYEVLIKVEAASLNYLETALVKGQYKDVAFPFTPGAEGAGVVAATGSKVTAWKPGDRVTTHYNQLWQNGPITPEVNKVRTGVNAPGLLSEYYVIPEYALVPTPANLSSVEAATLPVAALTAWSGLMQYAGIKPGDTVLTQGTGGVSLFALQIALIAGAKVIATTGDESKITKLKSLGATEVINYRQHPEWHEEVKRLTHGKGVQATLDVAGSSTINHSVKSLAYNGFAGLVGFMSGFALPLDFMTLMQNYPRIQAFSVGNKENFLQMANAFEVNNVKPVIDSVYDLEDIQAAFYHLESGRNFGKIVVKIG